MTRDVTPDLSHIRLFLTEPHSCSYLKNQLATTAFVDPALPIDSELYNRLSGFGFRRSGKYLYIPRCQSCNACIPARIPVADFTPSRQQRRCLSRNRDVKIHCLTTINRTEHFELYKRYIQQRHSDGDMYPPNRSQYEDFIGGSLEFSRFLEFRLEGKLIASSLIDVLHAGVSAIYTYYDPELDARSLGTYAILSILNYARSEAIPYVYLGYWIKSCRKMQYKTRFQPIELLQDGCWQHVEPTKHRGKSR